MTDAEVRKLRHDPLELVTRAVQPLLWLGVFGNVMAQVRGFPTGNLAYLDFLAPGVLAQSALFVSIFYGIAAIWERDLGVLQKYLVSPASRSALVLGKALSAGVRGLSQAAIVYLLAFLMGIDLVFRLPNVLLVLLVIVIGSGLFATVSLIIACIVKTRERFMGIGQVLTMPLFFASNAIYDRRDARLAPAAGTGQPVDVPSGRPAGPDDRRRLEHDGHRDGRGGAAGHIRLRDRRRGADVPAHGDVRSGGRAAPRARAGLDEP